jgi:DNA-binding NarL/FixJ family response regulator
MGRDGVVLLVAARGPLQDGLEAALGAMPTVTRAEHAGDSASALARVAESRPSLVVLDDALRGDTTLMLLRLIKSVSPETRCLVLTDDVGRLNVVGSQGADAVMLQGTLPKELFETIARLLDGRAGGGASRAGSLQENAPRCDEAL